MARGGHLGFEVFIQNVAPTNPTPGDFWFDTSGGTVLNFRNNTGSWVAVSIPTAALDTLSNSVSVLSNAVSVLSQSLSGISDRLSVLSNAQSALSNAVSVLSNTMSGISNTVSVLSNSVSVLSNAVSVISNALSGLSQSISVISQQVSVLSVQVVSAISLHNALSQVVSVISVTLSALSTTVSVISAGLGGMQMRWVSTVQGVSSTAAAGIAISGLSLSLAAGGIYQVQGIIYYQVSAIPTTIGIAFNYPALVSAQGGGRVTGHGGITGGGGGHGQITSVLQGTFDYNASDSIVFSAILSAASTYVVNIDAMLNVSTAGTFQAQMRTSATTQPVNVFPGSFLRAFRIV